MYYSRLIHVNSVWTQDRERKIQGERERERCTVTMFVKVSERCNMPPFLVNVLTFNAQQTCSSFSITLALILKDLRLAKNNSNYMCVFW